MKFKSKRPENLEFVAHVLILKSWGTTIGPNNSSLIEMFGDDLYVSLGNPHSNREPVWDQQLWVNTTIITDEKNLIQDGNY
uniref:Uncharacterized protein n=1 Tax=Anopheles dirus TaxID=7168 RepID=A0A182NEX1_9DIPT